MFSSNIHHQDVENNENCNGRGGLHASFVYLTQKGNASVEYLQTFLTENYVIFIELYFKATCKNAHSLGMVTFWNKINAAIERITGL